MIIEPIPSNDVSAAGKEITILKQEKEALRAEIVRLKVSEANLKHDPFVFHTKFVSCFGQLEP